MIWLRRGSAVEKALLLFAATVVGAATPLVTVGCSDNTEVTDDAGTGPSGTGGTGGTPPEPETVTLHPDQPPLPGETECTVVITTGITNPKASHLPLCTPVDYGTNPPSGGPHWSNWAAFKKYDIPVPRPMYVHNLEHGSVVMAYRCEEPCPDVVDFLGAAYDDFQADALCVPTGILHRLVVTPDPDLDEPVAAAAWGATYVATCLDRESLDEFLADHYAKGPENTCAGGLKIDSPDGGLNCDGG